MANVAELQMMVQRLEAENRELVGQVNQGGGQQNEDRAAERAAEVQWRQQQHFQRALSSCPLFHAKQGGQSFRRHLNNFKLWKISRGIEDNGLAKIALAQSMRDSAAERTRHVEPGTAHFEAAETYSQYEELVSNIFQPSGERALSRTEFEAYKQGCNEDVGSYLSIKTSLYQIAFAPGERSFISLRTAVVKGLYSNVIKRMTMRQRPETEEELHRVVCDCVAAEREAFTEGFAESTSLDGLRAISQTFKAEGGGHTDEAMDISEMRHAQAGGKKNPDRKCYRCQSSSHMIKNCPKKEMGPEKKYQHGGNDRSKKPGGKRDLECFHCHKTGHIKANCFRWKKTKQGGKIHKMEDEGDDFEWPEEQEDINELRVEKPFLGEGLRKPRRE